MAAPCFGPGPRRIPRAAWRSQGPIGRLPDTNHEQGEPDPRHRIQGFLNTLWDGGAIYTLGQQGTSARDGELIVGNVVSDKR
ncbi:MAG TPA: hypothetical protein VIX82_13080, partial [Solirubrobacteraceae bacterium]